MEDDIITFFFAGAFTI
jgi:cytochrome P450